MIDNYSIERAERSGASNSFVLTIGENRIFYVGELVCWLFERVAEGKARPVIRQELNERFEGQYVFTEERFNHIYEETLQRLSISPEGVPLAASTNSPISNIRGKTTITKGENIKWLTTVLRPLFSPAVFFSLFVILLAVNYYLMHIIFTKYISIVHQVNSIKQCGKGIDFLLLFYPSAFLILYAHELGHAAASSRFGVVSKNIGLGFYLIFPILYTELNGVWKLDRTKRTIINLAGIFVQLLLNIVLVFIVFKSVNPTARHISQYLIQMNVFTMILNVNPFLKFDGYWILSDLFRLPILRQQSNYYFVKAINYLFPRVRVKVPQNVEKTIRPRNPFLIVYSLLKYCFFGYIFFAIPRGFIYSLINLWTLSREMVINRDYSVCEIESVVKTVFSLTILVYFLRKPVASILTPLFKKMRA